MVYGIPGAGGGVGIGFGGGAGAAGQRWAAGCAAGGRARVRAMASQLQRRQSGDGSGTAMAAGSKTLRWCGRRRLPLAAHAVHSPPGVTAPYQRCRAARCGGGPAGAFRACHYESNGGRGIRFAACGERRAERSDDAGRHIEWGGVRDVGERWWAGRGREGHGGGSHSWRQPPRGARSFAGSATVVKDPTRPGRAARAAADLSGCAGRPTRPHVGAPGQPAPSLWILLNGHRWHFGGGVTHLSASALTRPHRTGGRRSLHERFVPHGRVAAGHTGRLRSGGRPRQPANASDPPRLGGGRSQRGRPSTPPHDVADRVQWPRPDPHRAGGPKKESPVGAVSILPSSHGARSPAVPYFRVRQ